MASDALDETFTAKSRLVVTLGLVSEPTFDSFFFPTSSCAQRASRRTGGRGVSKGQKGRTAFTNHLNSHSNGTRKLFCLSNEQFTRSSHGQGVPDVWFGLVRFGLVWYMDDIYLLNLNSAGHP